jgi:vacuolar-type H+-ATPase subunit H
MSKDNNFQSLLDAEKEAEQIISEARDYRNRLLEETMQQTHQQEVSFEHRIPEIHQSALIRANQHAEQIISDYQHRHDERSRELRELAEHREQEALESAFNLFITSTD